MTPCMALAGEGALEFRTFPEGPLYVNQVSQGLHASDVILHNLAIINRSTAPLTVDRITLSVMQGDTARYSRVIDGHELEKAIDRIFRSARHGVFKRLPELFGHDRMFDGGEALSATPRLEPNTALATSQNYLVYRGDASALRVSVDYAVGGPEPQPETDIFTISIERYESQNVYCLPFKGRWYLLTGPDASGDHRAWQNTEFAYDFARTDDGGSFFGNEGFAPTDYYAYGQPVLAASDGVVVMAIDRYPEAPLRAENAVPTGIVYS